MNSKQFIRSMVSAGILTWCWTPRNKNDENNILHTDSIVHQQTKKELADTLLQVQEINEDANSDVIMLNIDAIQDSKDIADISLSKHIKNNYKSMWVMLWWTDGNEIMRKYNPQIKKWINASINDIDTLYVPRISPSLRGFFNENLEDFLAAHDTISTLTWNNKNVIITTKNDVGMFSTAVYVSWKLQYAYAASPWMTGKQHSRKGWRFQAFTPMWSYIITKAKADKKSDQHDYMAFYLWFYEPRGIWLHGSQLVNGKINDTSFRANWQSHGCIRWVHIYRYLTFKKIKPLFDARKEWHGDPIAVVNYRTPSESEKKDAEWYALNKLSLDYSRKGGSYTKPIVTAETWKLDTVDFSHFVYLYWLKDSIMNIIQMKEQDIIKAQAQSDTMKIITKKTPAENESQ